MKELVTFEVHGKAQPRGSKQSLVPINKRTGQPFRDKKTGRVVVSTTDSNKKSKGYMQAVAAEAKRAMRETGAALTRAPVALEVTVYRTRLGGHLGTGRNAGTVKASAPAYPATKPDLGKVMRGIEDAMTGVVYADDAQICVELLKKEWGESDYVRVRVLTMEETVGQRLTGRPAAEVPEQRGLFDALEVA